jgi:phosphoglycolate phosphatase-like HAD superfamily hydrolase
MSPHPPAFVLPFSTSPHESLRLLAVFDLDGTLVDSAPQIAHAASQALDGLGIVSPQDVGPPLFQMLATATGLPASDSRLVQAANAFARLYDPIAHEARLFEGVGAMLSRFAQSGCSMALATNKRRAPTWSIVRHQGWERVFDAGIYGLEDFKALGGESKDQALIHARVQMNLGACSCHMIGDTSHDLNAALRAGFDGFHLAQWGCAQTFDTPKDGSIACHEHPTPDDLWTWSQSMGVLEPRGRTSTPQG